MTVVAVDFKAPVTSGNFSVYSSKFTDLIVNWLFPVTQFFPVFRIPIKFPSLDAGAKSQYLAI